MVQVFAFLLLCASVAHSELLQVTVLARHGNRAPNKGTDLLCPNFAHVIEMFDVPVSHERQNESHAV